MFSNAVVARSAQTTGIMTLGRGLFNTRNKIPGYALLCMDSADPTHIHIGMGRGDSA